MAATPEMSVTQGISEKAAMEAEKDIPTPDVHNVPLKIQRAKEVYREYDRLEEQPSKVEMAIWYLYGLCSYFIHTVVIPIVFPLIISQIVPVPPTPVQGWDNSSKGFLCRSPEEMQLYQRLKHNSIEINGMKFSPLEWTSLSWAAGIFIASPILAYIATLLDHGQYQQLIFAAANALGALFCLPAGFFRVTWIFPPYIAAIVVANTICTACHTRNFGLMVRGFTESTAPKEKFSERRAVAGWLSVYGTAAGSVGAAIIASFTFNMLRHSDNFTNLWVVSIFSGLKWFVGIVHAVSVNRPGAAAPPNSTAWSNVLSIFKYPHAAGSLAGVFLSSFVSMSIFTAGVLYVVGELCFQPVYVLYLWLIYFLFPLLSLPLLQPLQKIMKTDAVRMQLLGFLLSAATTGAGFYFRNKNWNQNHVLLMAAVQSTATGILHSFGRVLLLDCSPAGKEGAFSVWFSWVRAVGMCGGFAVASTFPASVGRSFGIAFCTAVLGIVTLIFGNISNFGGAKAAGHVREDVSEDGSPVNGLDIGGEGKSSAHKEVREEGRIEI